MLERFRPGLRKFRPGLRKFRPGLRKFRPGLRRFRPDLRSLGRPRPREDLFGPKWIQAGTRLQMPHAGRRCLFLDLGR